MRDMYKYLLMLLITLILLFLASPAKAVVKECTTFPLITYHERAIIKKHLKPDSKPSSIWSQLSNKERINLCRTIANLLKDNKS